MANLPVGKSSIELLPKYISEVMLLHPEANMLLITDCFAATYISKSVE
jgi:hypothetical protein